MMVPEDGENENLLQADTAMDPTEKADSVNMNEKPQAEVETQQLPTTEDMQKKAVNEEKATSETGAIAEAEVAVVEGSPTPAAVVAPEKAEASTAPVPALPAPPAAPSPLSVATLEEREKRALAAERRMLATSLTAAEPSPAAAEDSAESAAATQSAQPCTAASADDAPVGLSKSDPAVSVNTADPAATVTMDDQDTSRETEPLKVPVETTALVTPEKLAVTGSGTMRAPSSSIDTPNSCEPLLRGNSEQQDDDQILSARVFEEPPPPPTSPPSSRAFARFGSAERLGAQTPQTFQRVLMRPVPREEAGESRLKVRDAWNIQELHIEDLLERYSDVQSIHLDEASFRDLLTDLQGDIPSDYEFKSLMCLADQDKDGMIEYGELQYGLRAHYGFQCLQQDHLRKCAEYNFDCSGEIDKAALLNLLTDLNGGLCPEEREVEMVLGEAAAVGDGLVARRQLIRGVGAWYAHVARRDTSCTELLYAGIWRFLPAREHHTEVLSWIAWVAPLVSEALQSFRRGRTGEEPIVLAAGLCQMLLRLSLLFLCCLALLFPTLFFSWMIYFGSTRGSDLCPKDLPGLLVWCGAVGLATLVVSCVSPASHGDRSYVRFTLKLILMTIPWTGVRWTYQLTRVDRNACDPMMYWVSVWVWSLLAVLEIMVLTAVCFGIGTVYTQEQKLRERFKRESLINA